MSDDGKKNEPGAGRLWKLGHNEFWRASIWL